MIEWTSAVVTDLVVVCYRTPRDARSFVDSVIDTCDPGEVMVWIVDVDPVDSCEVLVTRLEVAGFRSSYLHVGYNCGYGRAVNLGASRGTGDVIGVFNADTKLWPGVVESCVEALADHPTWGVVGPRQVDSSRKITHAGIFGKQTRPQIRGWHQLDRGQFCDVEECIYVAGSAMFIRRSVWNEMAECPVYRAAHTNAWGALLETPHYYEDAWLCSHLRAHGYGVIYKGDVTMNHEWHKASKKGGHADRQMRRSREIFRSVCRAHSIEHE